MRAYFLYLFTEKRVAPSPLMVVLSGVKFFYVYMFQGGSRFKIAGSMKIVMVEPEILSELQIVKNNK